MVCGMGTGDFKERQDSDLRTWEGGVLGSGKGERNHQVRKRRWLWGIVNLFSFLWKLFWALMMCSPVLGNSDLQKMFLYLIIAIYRIHEWDGSPGKPWSFPGNSYRSSCSTADPRSPIRVTILSYVLVTALAISFHISSHPHELFALSGATSLRSSSKWPPFEVFGTMCRSFMSQPEWCTYPAYASTQLCHNCTFSCPFSHPELLSLLLIINLLNY